MDEREKEFIKKITDGYSDLYNEFLRSAVNEVSNLQIARIDYLQKIATLIVGISAASHFLVPNLSGDFLAASVVCSLFTIVLAMSYIREDMIRQLSSLQKENTKMKTQRDGLFEKAHEALREDNFKAFFNYVSEQIKDSSDNTEKRRRTDLEIFNFLFFLSIGFLGFSYIANEYNFGIFSFQTFVMAGLVYLFSYREWALKLLSSSEK